MRKNLDVQVVAPLPDFLEASNTALWSSAYELLLDEVSRHTTTLIFANSRYKAERTALRMGELADETTKIGAHHGSMSREIRLETEDALKDGRLDVLVATSSLELGIDIGSVDIVYQLESPKSMAGGLQRIGRAGHLLDATSKGRILAFERDELVEAAAIWKAMVDGEVDAVRIPRGCLDVLAQQMVGVRKNRLLVEEAPGATPTVPWWLGPVESRTGEVGVRVGRLRREVASRLHDPSLPAWLQGEHHLCPDAATAVIDHVREQQAIAGVVPDEKLLLVESWRDELGRLNVIMHSPYGSRLNRTWGIAIAAAARRRFRQDWSVSASNDVLMLTRREGQELGYLPDEPAFALTFHDPANLYATCLEMANESGERLPRSRKLAASARMVVQAGQPLVLAYGQQLVKLTRCQITGCIEHLKRNHAGRDVAVDIDSWTGYPIQTHSVSAVLWERGFRPSKGHMRWPPPTAVEPGKPSASSRQEFLPYNLDPPPIEFGPEWVIGRASEQTREVLRKLLPIVEHEFDRKGWRVDWHVDWPLCTYRGMFACQVQLLKSYVNLNLHAPGVTDYKKTYRFRRWGRLESPTEVDDAYLAELRKRRDCVEASVDRHLARRGK